MPLRFIKLSLALVLFLAMRLCVFAQVQASFSLNLINGTPSTVPWTLTTANPGSSGQLTVSNAGTATTGIFGVARDNLNPGTGIVSVIYSGLTYCVFDTPTVTQLNYVVAAGTAGQCHQVTSYPTSGQVIGRVVGSQLAANIFQIVLYPPEIRGGAGGSGVSCPSCTANSVMLWTGTVLANSSITDNSGVTIGSPTGGAKGTGTLNATALYSNGVLINPSNNNIASYTGSIGILGNQTNGSDSINHLCVNGICPVTAFGAIGDDITDDSLAIQTALTTACTNQSAVYFPTQLVGSFGYKTSYPMIDSCASTVPIYGDSQFNTSLYTQFPIFPLLVHYPSTYASGIGGFTGASLVSGSTTSLNFPARNKFVVDLEDGYPNAPARVLNGLTGFTIDGWINWAPTTNDAYAIFSVGGNDGANPSAVNPTLVNSGPPTLLKVSGDGSVAGTLSFALNIAGTVNTASASTAITKLASHYIRAVLDPNGGTPKMCLYVDTAQVGSVHTVTGGTTIQQLADETMAIGGFIASPTEWPDSIPAGNGWIGQMLPLRLSSTALNACSVTTITVPTAPLTHVTNDIFINNGISGSFGTPALPSAPVLRNEENTNFYQYEVLRATGSLGAAMEVHDLQFHTGSVGILDILSPSSRFNNLTFVSPSQGGLELWNNSYSSKVSNINCSNTNFCLGTLSISDAEIHNLQDTASNYSYIGQSGGRLYGHISAPGGSNSGAGLVLSCQTNTCDYTISGFGSDVESSAASIPIKIVALGGTGNYLIEEDDLQTNAGANLPGIYYNNFGGAGVASITFINTHYEGGTPAELIHFVSGTNPFTWINPQVNGAPWSLNATIPMTDEVDPNTNNALTTCALGCFVTVQGH